MTTAPATLRFKPLGIDTAYEHIVFMHAGCHVCRAEGFFAQTRIVVHAGDKSLIATLYVINDGLLSQDEISLSMGAQHFLGIAEGDPVSVSHVPYLRSASLIRAKIYGERLDRSAMQAIIDDTVTGRLSELHLSAFVTACAGDNLDLDEIVALTEAMVAAGERLSWPHEIVVDKHCVGGLPGNRTTPIVVAIVTACGLIMPKTSSRAITSPAGTADTMEVLAPVNLDLGAMRRVVEDTGGCLVWGGAMQLSPADDVLIRVERPLDLDSDGQLVASILSKKIAAGSNRVLIDLPVGPTAKIRSIEAAKRVSSRLEEVGRRVGIDVRTLITDGMQPVGRGIGPALEARDVLQVLRNEPGAPADLRERSLLLAGKVLEMGGKADGAALAAETLASGDAWRQFLRICEAQGGLREVPVAPLLHTVVAAATGRVANIDNRVLARIAKLAGAPQSVAAGVDLHVDLDDWVERGQPLFSIHAQAPGELRYARAFQAEHPNVILVEEA
ncbi:MAG: putative thymidine phosphorylase [Moraxellaceae bacterium]|jgi:thymidine phosphorylase|nr:putative thymidine phosphorylase [Moraxellaceae bacterium]